MVLFLNLLLLLPAASRAAVLCQPLSELHETINHCSENPGYVPPAKNCHDRYKATIDARYPQIEKELKGDSTTGKDVAQNLKFDTTKTVYQHTDAELTDLINLGNQTLSELEAYADDFVPPIPSWAPGHWKPNRNDPNDPARSLQYYCWSEPMKDMDPLIADVKMMIDQLSITRAKTRQLHGDTSERDGKLAVAGGDSGLGAKRKGVSGGTSENKASTVTGKIRNDNLTATSSTGIVKTPTIVANPAKVSTITSSSAAKTAPAKGDAESLASALKGRDGQLAAPAGSYGTPSVLPSVEELAKEDARAGTIGANSAAAALLLDPAVGGSKTGAVQVAERAPASAAGNGITVETPLDSSGLAGHEGSSPEPRNLSPEARTDVRDLFERTHAAYERTQRRKQI